MKYSYLRGIKVDKMSDKSAIKPHVREPLDVPRVQGPMEAECQIIFAGQVSVMLKDLVDEMIKMKK